MGQATAAETTFMYESGILIFAHYEIYFPITKHGFSSFLPPFFFFFFLEEKENYIEVKPEKKCYLYNARSTVCLIFWEDDNMHVPTYDKHKPSELWSLSKSFDTAFC